MASFTIACTTILVDLCIGNPAHLRLIICVVAALCVCVGLVDQQVSVDVICDVIPLLRSLHQAVSVANVTLPITCNLLNPTTSRMPVVQVALT